ncbi:DUF3150 domain-containing protein [Roseibacillus persicicus]|uniref:DUF3150 domain-containing protein n=1 Tax=Roseibacillus persicicus TaxID=454148 RepID=UPI00280CB459|nr:DUF3150 domain-containing protein [Roseibacillus persicicus]MDQ8192609.1 DUF3150 domain-containing protein [Roseibacillus persicicus]
MNQNQNLLEAVCRRGVLASTSVRYWRGCKRLNPEDLGLDPSHVSDRLIQLGHKRLIPREALSAFALIESRTHALVEGASFPFLGGIGRFVPNPRLGELTDRLESLREEFREATLDFVAGYGPLRENAMNEWREAAQHLNGSAERLIATIEQSFPPAGEIPKRFSFSSRLFQIAAPDHIRLEVAEGMEQMEVSGDRRRIAEEASRRLQADLNDFIQESVASLRQETAQLLEDVLATIDGSENGVHQRTLNRLTSFIENFRSLNFAKDEQLESQLERFRRDLLTRSAEEYRNDSGAMTSLSNGLELLRQNAVQLAQGDARDVLSRFGQMGTRRLASVA